MPDSLPYPDTPDVRLRPCLIVVLRLIYIFIQLKDNERRFQSFLHIVDTLHVYLICQYVEA